MDRLFDVYAHEQYHRSLLFSSLAQLVSGVVLGKHASVHAGYKKMQQQLGVSLTAVYEKPRASKTDPQSRRMKMPDGGTRPALNVQLASDGDAQLVIAVEVTSHGSDCGLMKPMYDDICDRYGVRPAAYLVDGGDGKKDDVTHVEQQHTQVYSPLYGEKKQLAQGADPYAPRRGESPEMTAYRARMGTDEGKAIYRRRAAIAEFPHAECRNRGLRQFRVRGLAKAQAQTLWHVLAHNFLRLKNLVCRQRQATYLEVLMGS